MFLATLGAYIGLLLFAGATYSAAQSDVQLNRRAFVDLGHFAIEQVESKSVDLNESFVVELTGTLSKDGKIDPTTAKFTRTEGSEKIVAVAKRALEAVNHSGLLGYLSDLATSKIVLQIVQNESDLIATVSSELLSESRAKTISTAMALMMDMVKQQKREKAGNIAVEEELALLNATRISSDAKTLVITLRLPKTVAREMIGRRLVR